MDKYTNYIGIDVSKETLDICIFKNNNVVSEQRITNDTKALDSFTKRLHRQGIRPENTLTCCEHTGLYTSRLINWSFIHNYKLWVEKPIQIKRSMGLQRDKNDKKDAKRIAEYAFRYHDKATIYQKPRKVVQQLRYLLAQQCRLKKTKKKFTVPLQEIKKMESSDIYALLEPTTNSILKSTEKALKEIEKEITKLVNEDEKLAKTAKYITSVDGIGPQISTAIIAATNEFKNVKTGRELACYAGVVPFQHQSGTSVRGKNKVSHFANKELKRLLHLGALSAITHSEEFRTYYERKIREGKNKMSVINAVRNKLALRIFACVKQEIICKKNVAKNLVKS